ncbi:MAG: T9SS type A sorting domain-containing protein [Bacteroidales bacterium]|nr:T9SS type A sorting domain-containing protein [Bacteroidales bacterium]
MRKTFTLAFLMGIFGLFTTNLFAQEDASIDPADIRYWIGEGEKEVVFIVNWNEPDTALAWGYRFSEEAVTVEAVMDAIAEADSRFDYQAASGWLSDITFNDGNLDLALAGSWWMFNVNGSTAMDLYTNITVGDGDWIKWGDESCGVLIDPENYFYVWEKEVAAVYPLADEAMIDFSEILYWVGEGEHELVFAVNWAEPNRCLAWGYRFDGDFVILKDVMDKIADADGRFNYVPGAWGVDDITYDDGDLHLALAGMWWLFNVNGMMGMVGYDQQELVDGDFIKWGDESCATEIAEWTYVWTQEVEPVSVYTGMDENSNVSFAVYPNPAFNETFVILENSGLNVVSVYDIQGRLVSSQSFVALAGEQARLSLENLNGGVYFVSVKSENAVSTAKLVVK